MKFSQLRVGDYFEPLDGFEHGWWQPGEIYYKYEVSRAREPRPGGDNWNFTEGDIDPTVKRLPLIPFLNIPIKSKFKFAHKYYGEEIYKKVGNYYAVCPRNAVKVDTWYACIPLKHKRYRKHRRQR